MSFIITSKSWGVGNRAPRDYYTIDRSAPTARGIQFAWGAKNGRLTDLIGNGRLTTYTDISASANAELNAMSPRFNGTTAFAAMGDSPGFDSGDNDFCIEGWIAADAVGDTDLGYVMAKNASFADRQFGLGYNKSGGSATAGALFLQYQTAVGQVHNSSNAAVLVAGKTQHVVAQRVGDSFKFYVDGVDAGLQTLSGTHDVVPGKTARVTIGRQDISTFEYPFAGTIHSLSYRNVSLTDQEVWYLYAPQSRWSHYLKFSRTYFIPAAAAGGLSIPIAAYHYNHNMRT